MPGRPQLDFSAPHGDHPDAFQVIQQFQPAHAVFFGPHVAERGNACGPIAVAHAVNFVRGMRGGDTLNAGESIDQCVANGSYVLGAETQSIPGLGSVVTALTGVETVSHNRIVEDQNTPASPSFAEALDLARTRPLLLNRKNESMGHIAAAVADRSGAPNLWLVQGGIGGGFDGEDGNGLVTAASWTLWSWQMVVPSEAIWDAPGASEAQADPEASQADPGSTSTYFTPEQVAATLGCTLETAQANWPLIVAALREQGIFDRLSAIAALATIGVEVGATFDAIREFGTGQQMEGRVDLGNVEPGDGPRFMGRGFIQLTGRSNYHAYGQQLGLDLEGNPDLALDTGIAARILAAYFLNRNIPAAAVARNWTRVRLLVNGGDNGLPRFLELVSAFDALPNNPEEDPQVIADLNNQIQRLETIRAHLTHDVADALQTADDTIEQTDAKAAVQAVVNELRRHSPEQMP